MKKQLIKRLIKKLIGIFQGLIGAVVFYTQIPIPSILPYQIYRIARFAPWVGLFIGGCLVLGDLLLAKLGLVDFSRAVWLVCLWVALTGGLHLDGVMDTADGLAVQDPQQRLQVMQDSRTGAFGVMAAILLILLKIAALTDLSSHLSPYSSSLRMFGLLLAPTWGRWGQVLAIALYPYLKPTGKGAFLKQEIKLPQDLCWGLACLGILAGFQGWKTGNWQSTLSVFIGGGVISGLTGYWFHRRLGGHTGDIYGAVVEWTEAIFLSVLVIYKGQ